jgi:ferredoxin-NADP reductase
MFEVHPRGTGEFLPTPDAGSWEPAGSHEPVDGPIRGPIAPRWVFPVIDGLVGARPTRVVGVDAQTPAIHRLRIERPAGYRFRPGQHALLRLVTDHGPDLRPLSLAGPPDGPHLEFATRAGTSAFKQAFLALQPGDPVKVSRPMGGLRYDDTHPAVLVAGGIGITPLRSLLRAGDVGPGAQPIRLLYSNRTAGDIPFADELSALARGRDDVSITWVLTQPDDGPLPDGAHVGRISEDLLRRQELELPGAIFYVTGPAAMVSDVRQMLRRVGVEGRRVRSVAQGYRRAP